MTWRNSDETWRRTREIVDRIMTVAPDILCLQELWATFDSGRQAHVLERLRADQQYHVLTQRDAVPKNAPVATQSSTAIVAHQSMAPIDSGLVLACRHPLSDAYFWEFSATSGLEYFAGKGVLYGQTEVDGHGEVRGGFELNRRWPISGERVACVG